MLIKIGYAAKALNIHVTTEI